MTKLQKAIDLFDEFNKQDPNQIEWAGKVYAAEYFYALQLYIWVTKLEPAAVDHLLLASRSQHIGRWKSPRSLYPLGKAGYLNWRKDLAKFHAATAGELMHNAGYGSDDISAVQRIILKENLRSDPEVQVMENALCLVFLQFQFPDFITKHDDAQVLRILKKSWAKMTAPGRQAAMELSFSGRAKELFQKALAT